MIKIKLKRLLSAMMILTFGISTLVYADNSITVQEAVKKATENSLAVKKYSNAVVRYQRDYADALASSRQIGDMLEIDKRFRKLSLKDPSERTPQENMEYQILSEMLGKYMSASDRLDMEKASELTPSSMEYMLNVNKSLLKTTKENIYLTTYKDFNEITKAEDAIRVNSTLVGNLESNYKTAAAKFAQGKLSKNSFELVRLELEKARIELNTLQLESKKKVVELNKNLGMPLESKYDKYINEEIPKEIAAKPLQEYIDTAYANNGDYKAALQGFELKKKEYEMTTGLYAVETSSKNISAYIAYTEAKDQLDTAKIGIQLQVMNAYNGFKSQLTNLEKSKIALDLQGKNLQEIKSKYSLGLTTELEVSEANISYYQSQLDNLSAARDAWLAKLNLDLICGVAENNN